MTMSMSLSSTTSSNVSIWWHGMPSIVWPTFAGSMSNAVVIFNFRPRPLKYLVMAWPRCPMPMTAMLVTVSLSRMLLMKSMSTFTS